MKNKRALVTAIALVGLTVAAPALAQGADPLAGAANGADSIRKSLQSFALAVGGIGMVSCLLLGFFGKLNWKWVATGIGVSFALATVPGVIGWLNGLGGAAN